jgi:hypothetical protein
VNEQILLWRGTVVRKLMSHPPIIINNLQDRPRSDMRFRAVSRAAISGIDGEPANLPMVGSVRLLLRFVPNLAKVGVEGSNPFARSKFSQENQSDKDGPSGPFLLT